LALTSPISGGHLVDIVRPWTKALELLLLLLCIYEKHRHKQHGDLINLVLFLENKESWLIIKDNEHMNRPVKLNGSFTWTLNLGEWSALRSGRFVVRETVW
jgi:hypothetical protein